VIEEYKDVKLPLCYLFCIQSHPGKLLMTGICIPKEGRYLKKKQYSKKIKKEKTSVN
jgi:hypothetical protein